jgi:DNA repair protein SbcD/Mre11
MKIAITADVHLASYKDTPERYHALKDIFQQAIDTSMDSVLISGDLFDKDFNNYSDFEKLAHEFSKLNIWILPGNHDSRISSSSLVGTNLRLFEKAEIVEGDIPFLLIPYQSGITMGEAIASHVESLTPKRWVLCSHGDWLDGIRIPNPLETGTYMPLTRTDLDRYQPARVFLGHIHARSDGPIHYPGSPCGIDITETGERRFLVFDSSTGDVESKLVHTDVIYHMASLLVLPVEDEATYMRKMISVEKDKWKISKDNIARARIRVKVKGYTQDKSALNNLLLDEFKGFLFYKDEGPDLSEVAMTIDQNRIKIAEKVKEKVENMELNPSLDEPDRDLIFMKSLQLVFEC